MLVPVGVLSGSMETSPRLANERDRGQGHTDSSTSKASSSAVNVVGKMKTRQKEVGFQVLVGAAQKLQPSLDVWRARSGRSWLLPGRRPRPATRSTPRGKRGMPSLHD